MEDTAWLETQSQSHNSLPRWLAPYASLSTLIWAVCGVVLILWGLRLWGYGTVTSVSTVPSVVIIAWGLFLLVWHGQSPEESQSYRWILAATLTLTVVALAVWSYTQIITAPAYGTDELAFDQYAAQLVIHGINPYGRSLGAAFHLFQVSPNGYTWTLAGTPVTLLSYPAQSFLIYVPFMLLGWTAQVGAGVNVMAWAAGLVILFFSLPRPMRPLVIILGSLSVYISYAVGGVTDALFVPFLILAAREWDRYPTKKGLWSPLWFGLAMGIKQTPWVFWPFLLLGIAAEGKRTFGTWKAGVMPAIRYGIISGLVFLIPNIPFVLDNPLAWLRGILTPLISSTVPDGQGLITLSLFLHLGGGSLSAYTLLSMVVLLGLLAIFALTYPRLKSWIFIVPSVALFVATRSFGSYLVMLVPSAVMAWATTARSVPRPWNRVDLGVMGGVGAAMAVSLVAALEIPSPLTMSLVGVHTTGQLATVDRVVTSVTNRTNHLLHPHFTADMSGTFTAFWTKLAGPPVLDPHQTAQYTLAAPNFYAQPALTGGFQMVAFTARSKTISHTATYLPTTWHVALIPDAVNHPVPYGHPLTVTAEILNRMDQPVHVKGVPIYLGQVIYAQRGLQYGEAMINGGHAGQTPVSAMTNAAGQATFVIRDVHPESDPIYFEANLVNNQDYYPYGYSQILPVRFG